MSGAPSDVTAEQLDELGIRLVERLPAQPASSAGAERRATRGRSVVKAPVALSSSRSCSGADWHERVSQA